MRGQNEGGLDSRGGIGTLYAGLSWVCLWKIGRERGGGGWGGGWKGLGLRPEKGC